MPGYSKQYKKLYEEEKRQNERLKEENKRLRREVLLTPDTFHFNKRQLEIIEYVRKHPGTTKVQLISELQNSQANRPGYGTYVTLHKEIQYLIIKLNVIRIQEIHKQKHKLYLNENNLILAVHTDLTNFKKSFDEILEKISENRKWQEYRNSGYWGIALQSKRLLDFLILIYEHVFNVYLTNILFRWSIQLKNDDFLLNKIYSLILFSFIEIQTELAKKFDLRNNLPEISNSGDYMASPILYQITSKTFFLDPFTIMAIVTEFHKFGLHLDIVPLIDVSWKIGVNLYKLMEGRHLNHFKRQISEIGVEDWQRLITFYLDKKFGIDPLNPAPPSKFDETKWFHMDKKAARKILGQIKLGHEKK